MFYMFIKVYVCKRKRIVFVLKTNCVLCLQFYKIKVYLLTTSILINIF